MPKLPTRDVKDIEIFATGVWNGEAFSTRDLDDMAEAFKKTKDRLKPYLKLGHSRDQSLLRSDQLPAAGWLDNVRVVGEKLVADFLRVPGKIADLLEAGAYRRVSAEIFENISVAGEKFRLALKAVALLGGETPAVETLEDIMKLYGGKFKAVSAYNTDAETRVFTWDVEAPKGGDNAMEVKELTEKLLASEKKVSTLEGELGALKKEGRPEDAKSIKELSKKNKALEADVKSEKDRADAAEAKVTEYAAKARKAKVEKKVGDLISSGKLAPAQKDFAIALLESATGEKKFKIGDKEFGSEEDLITALIESGPGLKFNTSQKTGAGKASREEDPEGGIEDKELDAKIQEYMKEHKVSYREAYVALHAKESGE